VQWHIGKDHGVLHDARKFTFSSFSAAEISDVNTMTFGGKCEREDWDMHHSWLENHNTRGRYAMETDVEPWIAAHSGVRKGFVSAGRKRYRLVSERAGDDRRGSNLRKPNVDLDTNTGHFLGWPKRDKT